MHESRQILESFERAQSLGLSAALATVIRVEGSSYRRPGAKMLILENGEIAGSVSGGCLERDLIRRSARALSLGQVDFVTYDTRLDHQEEGYAESIPSLGCEGVIEIWIDPSPTARLALWRAALAGRRDALWFQPLPSAGANTAYFGPPIAEADALARRESFCEDGVFYDLLRSPPRLVVFGAGPDALPLTRLAHELGWLTTVVDCRSAFPQPRRLFPHVDAWISSAPEVAVAHAGCDARTLAIVMTHNLDNDRVITRGLLALGPRYLGLLGPRKRGEMILREIAAETEVPFEELRTRAQYPVGVDIGGEGATAIALSALAEMQALIHGRKAGFLRDRLAPIHARPHTPTERGDVWN